MNLIYTSRTEGFEQDGLYRNPLYFQGPEEVASSVLVEGDWPEIVDAYESLDIPVEVLPEATALWPSDQSSPANAPLLPGILAARAQAAPATQTQKGKRQAAASSGKPQE